MTHPSDWDLDTPTLGHLNYWKKNNKNLCQSSYLGQMVLADHITQFCNFSDTFIITIAVFSLKDEATNLKTEERKARI